MVEKKKVGKVYSEIEESILIWLYDHPTSKGSTVLFIPLLHPGVKPYRAGEAERKAYLETQAAIETLILDKLVSGKPLPIAGGGVQHTELHLLKKGKLWVMAAKKKAKALQENPPSSAEPAPETDQGI
jgi:hypothetical protein